MFSLNPNIGIHNESSNIPLFLYCSQSNNVEYSSLERFNNIYFFMNDKGLKIEVTNTDRQDRP